MIRVAGNVRYTWRDSAGRVVDYAEVENMVPLVGCDLVVDLLGGLFLAPTHINVGIGTAPTTSGTVGLQTQIFSAPVDRRIKSAQKITFELVLPESSPTNGFTLSESGIFAPTLMLARALISPPRPKTAAISLTISHDILVEGA